MLAQIQDNTHKAYVALQSYVTPPVNIPIPGVVRTDRPKLSREQMAARYLKSVEGNPNIDINKARGQEQQKAPKMTQKSSNSIAKDQWPTLVHVDLSDELTTSQASRSLLETAGCVGGSTVEDYLNLPEKSDKLAYEVFGVADFCLTCIKDIPEFVVCSDGYLPLADLRLAGYPSGELHYRPVSSYEKYVAPPRPESKTPADKINAEIHDTLQNNKATRIYLSREQLDSYLTWRLSHGGGINFQYIRVDDKDEVFGKNVAIGGAVAAGVGMSIFVGMAINKCRRDGVEPAKKQQLTLKATAEIRQADQKETTPEIKNRSARRSDNEKMSNMPPEENPTSANTHHHDTSIASSTSSKSSSTPPTSSTSSTVVSVSTS
ncbi:MAG: hypothetical protein ACKOAO_04875, partial [Oxalobacteraceae bacterium]